MPGAGDFRACYVHTRKPAIRDCLACGRPICGKCGELSGDPMRCVSCVEAAQGTVKEEAEVQPVAGDRGASPVPAGEVTVFDDGTVVIPEPTPVPRGPAEPSAEDGREQGVPEDEARPGGGEPSSPTAGTHRPPRLPLNKRPLPDTAPAVPVASRERREGGRGKLPAPSTAREADSAPAGKRARPDDGKPRQKPPVRRGRSPADASASPEDAGKPVREKPRKKRGEGTGPISQVAYALPYAVGTAVLLAGAWLLLARFSRQWTQISVFTMGIAVPWVMFNATTMKKRMGKKVWTSPPPTWMISASSFAIVSLLTAAMQFLAYKLIYGSNPARLPYNDFAMRYLKWPDWLLVLCGLLLALLLPLMLRAGKDRSVGSVRKKAREAKGAGDGETGPAPGSSVTTGDDPEGAAETGPGRGEEDAGEP